MSAFAGPMGILPLHAVETASGLYVDVVTPDPKTISVHDIAWSLSRQARFAGHTISAEVWNVAQHSLFVSELIDAALNDPEDNYDVKESLNVWMNDVGMPDLLALAYPPRAAFFGLMHDATEAYLVDLPSPVKRHEALREPYKALEARLSSAIWESMGVPMPSALEDAIVTWADLLALQIEAGVMMPSRGRGWSGKLPVCNTKHLHLFPKRIMTWRESYDEFMSEYKRIGQDVLAA